MELLPLLEARDHWLVCTCKVPWALLKPLGSRSAPPPCIKAKEPTGRAQGTYSTSAGKSQCTMRAAAIQGAS